MRRSLLPLTCLLFVAACEVGPDYERPPVETPATFKEAGAWQQAEPADAMDRGAWWEVYNDPILDALEQQVEVSNQNLKAAEAAYRAAVAVTDATRSSLFPVVSVSGSGVHNGNGKTGQSKSYNLSGNAGWDIDVWGRIRRAVESDEANAEASAADLASARLSAQAQLATSYFDLRMQDEMRRLLDETAKADRKILNITTNQYKVGIAAQADVLSAQTQVETIEAQAINTDVARNRLEHAIAVLIGKPPASFDLAIVPSKNYRIPNIPATVPSALLQRRPDIAAYERAMAAANAQIGVAEGAWFPDISLSASAGFASTALNGLVAASTSFWSLGPTIAETLIDFGARQAKVDQAGAQYDQSVANYRQTVLTAFQQVEDNLSTLRVLGEQAKAQDAAVVSSRKAEQVTLNQYKAGIVPFNNVLTQESVRLSNEQTALVVLRNRLEASVALIQALGGGWDAAQLSAPQMAGPADSRAK